jgi:nucleoside 2-deoxyribosyltransferase
MHRPPRHLESAIKNFYKDFGVNKPIGFIIMRFGTTSEHIKIVEALKKVSEQTGVLLLRADGRPPYHANLLENVQVYLHACSFGIAIFEDAESKGYNPNVAYETGYLAALGKPVLPLKSSSIETLPTDLKGLLYELYDPESDDALDLASHSVSEWITSHFQIERVSDDLITQNETVEMLLKELYPGISIGNVHDYEHLARHTAGLLKYGYTTIGKVRTLLNETNRAREFVDPRPLPDFAVCAVSHAIALRHPEYTRLPVWKGTTVKRIEEGRLVLKAVDPNKVNKPRILDTLRRILRL